MHVCKMGLAICTPIPGEPITGAPGHRLELLSRRWHDARMSLMMPTNIAQCEIVANGMEVGEARNYAVDVAKSLERKPEFLFFLDYDVIPPHDAITKLLYRARHFKGHDVFAGVYCSKSQLPEPLIYKEDGSGPFWDWTVGDILQDMASVHMGLTMIRMSVFDRLECSDSKPYFKTTNDRKLSGGVSLLTRGTEDIYFCQRLRDEIGGKILVDTSILAGHENRETGVIYGLPLDSGPIMRCKWHPQHKDSKEYGKKKRALDIGAGSDRRSWPGYQTFTTDIREAASPDYVLDSLDLSLPDEHFDLVASSHHLEHLPRFEQERIWGEIFRVCKPGGRIEHIVPNLQWAAAHIIDGNVDENVMNVLYGSQEKQGYEREYNTHYFGYTPEIGKALAESAGFVDVEIRTWKDDPELTLNMFIVGRKPDRKPDKIKKRKAK